MLIRLDRDSVAAGDDVDSHEEMREVDGRQPLERFVAELFRDGYLPRISGGKASWVMRRSRRAEPLGVAATKYSEMHVFRLTETDSLDLNEVGESLFFEYAAQTNPNEVFEGL
ncbi:MAG: hypothetical protein ABI239_11800 [Aquihabitans sp.]